MPDFKRIDIENNKDHGLASRLTVINTARIIFFFLDESNILLYVKAHNNSIIKIERTKQKKTICDYSCI